MATTIIDSVATGSTLYYWLYPLLLALPSTIGFTLYYWLYPLLLALPSTIGFTLYYWLYPLLLALPSTIGFTLYYWLYPLLLALPSTITGCTLSTQDLAVPVIYSLKVMYGSSIDAQ